MAISTKTFILPLRGVQWVFWIILLGLSAYLVHVDSGWGAYTADEYSYLLFTAIWTLLVLVPLTLVALNFKIPIPFAEWVVLGLEALTMIFWFAAFIAIAVYTDHTWWWSSNVDSVEKAAAAFGAFEWLAFTATLVIVALQTFRSGRGAGAGPSNGNKAGEAGGFNRLTVFFLEFDGSCGIMEKLFTMLDDGTPIFILK
ncbi:MAG: hypothetical protein M1831_003984 [Alyxoria varia]|nr:MAG: hypothetical protein M1831_003984 [Alyxoria varia]